MIKDLLYSFLFKQPFDVFQGFLRDVSYTQETKNTQKQRKQTIKQNKTKKHETKENHFFGKKMDS